MIKAQLNIDVSKSTVWKYIRSNNLSFKRTKPYVGKANTQTLTDAFIQSYTDNVVSIDETFFYLYDYPRYGYSKRGSPLRRAYNHTPRKRKITLYMAISKERIIGNKLTTVHGNSNDFTEVSSSKTACC
jgi:hypothetical protein